MFSKPRLPVDDLERTVKWLEVKLTDLQDKSRRSNLFVLGIPQNDSDAESILKSKALEEVFFPGSLLLIAGLSAAFMASLTWAVWDQSSFIFRMLPKSRKS